MKRYPEIVILFLMTLGLLTSGANETQSRSVLLPDLTMEVKHDTTGYIRYIEVDSFNLTIFPPSSGIHFYKEGIVFLSKSKYEGKMLPQHVSFGTTEAYTAMVEDSVLGKHTIFSPDIPFSYPCEAITFSSDFNSMYFTMIPKKENKAKIFMAKYNADGKKQSGWTPELKPADFCTENSNYSHPTLSSDGKILIFASDKADSFGGMDLYVTKREGDNWSEPNNSGKLINSVGNEFFPFLDSDNNLFFSSDGLPGYGGFDVFTCNFNGTDWDNPMNLSRRINSENDDIAFSIDKRNGKSAFYTTRQKSGKGVMQLFKVSLNDEVVNRNLITISYIFNGERTLKPSPTLASTVTPVKTPAVEPPKKEPEVKAQKAIILPEVKKEEVKVVESPAKQPVAKVVTIKPTIPTPEEYKDVVIYRIQFRSTIKPLNETHITVNGKSYPVYEYFYLGEYRYTIGEFTELPQARELQSASRKSGYPQAFVAAFKNNTRSLDLLLFK